MSEPGFLAAELRVDEEQVRLAEPDGRTALGAVLGLDAVAARARLRFGPGRTCEPVARLLDRVIVQAEQAGLSPARLILAAGRVQAGEDIVRVRRTAHGKADWIASPTCRVEITLRPAGLHASDTSGPGAGTGRPGRGGEGRPERRRRREPEGGGLNGARVPGHRAPRARAPGAREPGGHRA